MYWKLVNVKAFLHVRSEMRQTKNAKDLWKTIWTHRPTIPHKLSDTFLCFAIVSVYLHHKLNVWVECMSYRITLEYE